MGKANFSDEFKRDAVAQITERGYRVTEERDILKNVWPAPSARVKLDGVVGLHQRIRSQVC
ncbi:hypothetical protein [Croceicoccus sp. Ery15]|uniref:hypothetical protein n=1 Tax=Croceicoccus sp. Ery15 TaxID=1703338 RepID=UPI001E3E6A7A|nr:hypothetical protein [Croceicoccus sp. Ery15]